MSAHHPSMRLPNPKFGLDGGRAARTALGGEETPAAGQRGIGQGEGWVM